jgi:hypothetical protein
LRKHLLDENCKDERKALERLRKLSLDLKPDG